MCSKNSLREDIATNEQYPFPCKRMKYTRRVGELLPNILAKIFSELGFEVWINPQQQNGVDLKIYKENNLFLVAEVLNWSIGSRLTLKRKNKILENLSQFECKKVLVHTIPLSGLNALEESGIDLFCIGYQVLPWNFYNFFVDREQDIARLPYSLQVKEDIERLILRYLQLNQMIYE